MQREVRAHVYQARFTSVCVVHVRANTCMRVCSLRVMRESRDVNRRPFRYTRHVPAMYRPIVFPARRGNFSQLDVGALGRSPAKTSGETLAGQVRNGIPCFSSGFAGKRDSEIPRDSLLFLSACRSYPRRNPGTGKCQCRERGSFWGRKRRGKNVDETMECGDQLLSARSLR